jgi:hypothetical protein
MNSSQEFDFAMQRLRVSAFKALARKRGVVASEADVIRHLKSSRSLHDCLVPLIARHNSLLRRLRRWFGKRAALLGSYLSVR